MKYENDILEILINSNTSDDLVASIENYIESKINEALRVERTTPLDREFRYIQPQKYYDKEHIDYNIDMKDYWTIEEL